MFISGYANKGKKFSVAFIKQLPLKTTMREKIKKINFTDQNVSSYNIDLTKGFPNWPFLKSGGGGVFTTRVSLRHTTVFAYSHATTPLGQSECVHYLSYFINI